MLNQRGLRRNHVGEAAGRDAHRVAAELVAHSPHQPLDHADVAPEQPRLHRPDRRPADDPRRFADVDARQPRRALKQGVGGNGHARADRAAEIFPLRRNRIQRRRRPEVDHDQRPAEPLAEFLERRDGVDDAIGADLGRVVVQDRHHRVDAGLHDHRRHAEIALHHRADRPGQRRHDRAEDDAADPDALDPAVREQSVDQQAELVGRALAQRLQPPTLDERRAVEHAEDDVGIADVDR